MFIVAVQILHGQFWTLPLPQLVLKNELLIPPKSPNPHQPTLITQFLNEIKQHTDTAPDLMFYKTETPHISMIMNLLSFA